MKLIDTTYSSCAALAALMEPVSPAMAVLQLSTGPLHGRLRVYGLGAFRISILDNSQTLFLSGQRQPDRHTFAFELGTSCDLTEMRAQGAAMPWPGFLGFNWELCDFDLRLPKDSQLITLLIPKTLAKNDARFAAGTLTRQRLMKCNLLELKPDQQRCLTQLLQQLTSEKQPPKAEHVADQFLDVTLKAFEHPSAETDLNRPRQERHQAALQVMHRWMGNPKEIINTHDLSAELAVSRSALFKGCQEHFGLSPTQIQRSIRLDRVRRELLHGSGSIGAIAAAFGFQSRSHFASRYRDQFGELPQETVSTTTH